MNSTILSPDTYLTWGHFDAVGKLSIDGFGRVDSVDVSAIPDDAAVYRSAGIIPRGKNRSNENVERVAVLTIDDVGTLIDRYAMEMLAPEPTDILETSPGNFQWQYVIKGGMDPADYVALRAAMKAHPIWGASHTTAPSSLIRVPMGVNGKPGRGSHRVVRTGGSGAEVGVEVFGAGTATPKAVPIDLRAPSDAHVEAALLGLPNNGTSQYCATREAWIKMGHALYGATGGTRLDLWQDWCSAQPQAEDVEKVWDSFHGTTTGWPTLRWAVHEWGSPHVLAGVVFDDGVVGAATGGTPPAKQLWYARAVEALYGSTMRFNLDRKAWAEFDGSIWRPLPSGVKLAARHSIEFAKHAPQKAKGDHDVLVLSFHDGVEGLCRQFPSLQARETDFDSNPMLLGTPKGTVDLVSGLLVPARATDMISKSTAVVPAAREDCPRWLKFIGEVTMGDPESEAFLQQWAGYCLTGLTVEEKILFLYGPGGNGKSKFADTLAWVLADYAVQPVADLFVKKAHGVGHTSKLAMLAGARLCTISEVPSGAAWDETLLTDITGGGRVTAGFKHRDEFTYQPAFKLTALGNHQPTFPGGINEAIRRRFLMMEFLFKPKVVDLGLFETLKKEAAGILRWAINGCLSWQKVGLMVPGKVTLATEDMFAGQDLVGLWIAARIERVKGSSVGATELFNDWIEWRNRQGDHEFLNSAMSFSKEMTDRRGFVRVHTRNGKEYQDIRLRSKAVEAFDRE